jgi:Ca2+-binding RTX toxin-like protein
MASNTSVGGYSVNAGVLLPTAIPPFPFATTVAYGTDGRDFLISHNAGEYLSGGKGGDWLVASDEGSYLFGGDGDDVLFAGAGADYMSGGRDNDTVSYAAATAGVAVFLADPSKNFDFSWTTSFAAGDTYNSIENVNGTDYRDQLVGDDGDNVLGGGGGSDVLMGGKGNDTLYGGTGRDQLTGGAGNDRLYGGSDADTFFFNKESRGYKDIHIADFEIGIDKIDLSQTGYGAFQSLGAGYSGWKIVEYADGTTDLNLLTLQRVNDGHGYVRHVQRIDTTIHLDGLTGHLDQSSLIF